MPVSIGTLPVVTLDYTSGGPGMQSGIKQLEKLLEADKGREGYLLVNVTVSGATVPIIIARSDLYVMAFQCSGSWYRFEDAAWPFAEKATSLGHDGQYATLGGLTGNLTFGAITGIGRLTSTANRPQWKESLRNLLVVVSECARLIPVRMQILGLLNGIMTTVPLAPLARYIQNWDKASKGTDMSEEVAPNLRVGFKDPTIIKR